MYRYIPSQAGKVTFADTTDISTQVTFGNSMGFVGPAKDGFRLLRTSMVFTKKSLKTKPNCDDACNTVEVTNLVRIETSSLLADPDFPAIIDEAIRVLNLVRAQGYTNGFLPSIDSTFPPA